jgi:putative tricarboxylic transport membrane protein
MLSRSAALVLGMALAPLAAHGAEARWKPEKNVEIVVPASPGSGVDVTARMIQRLLREKKLVEMPNAVVNKPGGASNIGLTYIAQHPGDAHHLLIMTSGLLATHIMGRSALSYTDITPLAVVASESVMFVVRAESPIMSAKDLAERFKADPASVSVAFAPALGNHNHIAAAQVVKSVGANPKQMKVVVTNGSAEALAALLGGHIDVVVTSGSALLEHLKAGRIRILAVSAEQRLRGALAAVPTWKELGIASVSTTWRGLFGPGGLKEEQIRYWDEVFARMAQLPEWRQYLEAGSIENTYLNARDSRRMMDAEYASLSAVLAELGLAK